MYSRPDLWGEAEWRLFMKKYFIIALAFVFVLGASTSNVEASKKKDSPVKQKITKEMKKAKKKTTKKNTKKAKKKPAATATPIPTSRPLVLPKVGNDTGKTLIQTVSGSPSYLYNSYIITSANGESVVVDPTSMPDKSIVDINPAAICSTHSHSDHTDPAYTQSYNVPTILYKRADIKTKDFHIYSIPSSHKGDTITEDGENVIIVFEVDGLRIAHMGDVGQTSLTEEQLKALGTIDIAFMQFENMYSDMSMTNKKGINIIKQLNPKIVIPTHYFSSTKLLQENLGGNYTEFENILEISKNDLPDTTLNIYRILNKHVYK